MALTLTAGNVVSGTNTGTVAVSYPVPGGGILAGDFLFLHIPIHKATQSGTEAAATPAGWTALSNLEGGANVAAGADAGLCRIYTFYTTAAGGETGSLNVTINNNVTGNSGSCAGGVMWHVHADSGTVDIAGATGDDATGGTGLSVTFSSNPGLEAGDLCLVTQATPTDTIPSGLTGTDIAATGATFNAISNGNSGGSALGLDGGIYRFAQTVATGPASAAPVWSGTLGGTTTNWYGPAALIRVRETTAAVTADANQYRPPAGWGLLWPNVEASLQLMGDRSTPQFPALDDAGSGSDTLAVAAAVPLSDTGTGTDTLSAAAAVPPADTGSGADALTVAVAVPLAETGSGADSLAVSIDAGADPYQAGVQIAGMFLQPNAASIQLRGSSEIIINTTPALPDTASGDDSLAAAVAAPLTETGTGTDALSIAVTVGLSDTGSGVDSLALAVAVPLAETGTGTDALSANVALALSDTGTAAENLAAGVPITLTETGTGVESLTSTATAPLAETATGTDALSIAVTLTLPETGTGTDALTVAVSVPLTETGSGADALSVIAEPDSYQAPQNPFPPFRPPFLRPGVVPFQLQGEATFGSASIGLTESGTATDALTISVTVELAETAVAVEALVKVVQERPGSWYGLMHARDEARFYAYQETVRPQTTCPIDGTLLTVGPDGQLYCPFDGWRA